MQRVPRVQYFSSDGQGTGTINMGVDGSSTPVEFTVDVPTGFQKYNIVRLLWHLQDTGAFDAEALGNGLTPSNGIQLEYASGSTTWDLLGGQPITQNSHFKRVAFDTDVDTWGIGDEVLTSRFTMTKILNGDELDLEGSDQLVIRINDLLTGLVDLTCIAEGWIE